jgi:hypothetical protein
MFTQSWIHMCVYIYIFIFILLGFNIVGFRHLGRNINWGNLRTGCWGECLDQRGRSDRRLEKTV